MLGHVSVPNPSTLVISHLDGTWPQLNRHDISGTGTPIALHVVVKSAPTLSVTNGGGVFTNCTAP